MADPTPGEFYPMTTLKSAPSREQDDTPGLIDAVARTEAQQLESEQQKNSNTSSSPTADHEHQPPLDPEQFAAVEDIPPNGGYGWVVCACTLLVNAHTWGVNGAYGTFLAHYLAEDTFPGATELQYALIGGLSISCALLESPFVTFLTRKLGTRPTMMLGALVTSAALFAAGSAKEIWQLFLSQGVCFGLGMGCLYIPATAVCPQWFSSKRSLAMGLASAGAGLGGLVYSLAAGAAIPTLGLAWTFRVFAFCTLAVNAGSALLLKDRNRFIKQPNKSRLGLSEFLNIEVVLLITWGVLTELGYITLLYSLPSYARSIGLTQHQGSVIGAMLNLGLALGRPPLGFASDKLGRINVASAVTLSCAVFCFAIWVPADSYSTMIVFALFAGACCGIFWGAIAPVAAEVTNLQRLPAVFGVTFLSLSLPTTFAEPIALEIVAASGYLSAKVFVGCMFIAATISVWLLRSWKLDQIQRKDVRGRREGAGIALPGKLSWLTARSLVQITRV
ncbi:hypothetical protein MBLNU230_g1763t1 [Neophaeotheca triangularis]